jgi:hypothetical protein
MPHVAASHHKKPQRDCIDIPGSPNSCASDRKSPARDRAMTDAVPDEILEKTPIDYVIETGHAGCV